MPIYQYRCGNGHQFERFLTVREHDSALSCEECNLVAQQVIGAPVFVTAAVDVCYDSPIDGRPITSHAARREDLKRNDCIPYDPEMKKDSARRQQERQAEFEAGIEETVSTEIARMPSAKRSQLVKEVAGMGVSLEVKRHG